MRKFLLFGTMLGVATTALAFGGVFSHGSKSTTYKGGVNAIGVHYNGEKKKADIQTGCPEHSAWNNDTLKCECNKWYAMSAETHECEETCTSDRQCGDTCCGDGNICVDGNKCCNPEWEQWIEYGINACCDASTSNGYDTNNQVCCGRDETAYRSYADILCCPNDYVLTELGVFSQCCPPETKGYISYHDEEGFLETSCCAPDKISYGTGENGVDECLE